MNERQNQIKDPNIATFEWIYKDPVAPQDTEDDEDAYIFDAYEREKHNMHVRTASHSFCQWLRTPDASLF
jgi:hypothetical protein